MLRAYRSTLPHFVTFGSSPRLGHRRTPDHLSLIGRGDTLKVIDQGTDDGVNAVNIPRLVERTTPGVDTTSETAAAGIIQNRHRIPERPLRADQSLVLQVPTPEPLRSVERREAETGRMHAPALHAGLPGHRDAAGESGSVPPFTEVVPLACDDYPFSRKHREPPCAPAAPSMPATPLSAETRHLIGPWNWRVEDFGDNRC